MLISLEAGLFNFFDNYFLYDFVHFSPHILQLSMLDGKEQSGQHEVSKSCVEIPLSSAIYASAVLLLRNLGTCHCVSGTCLTHLTKPTVSVSSIYDFLRKSCTEWKCGPRAVGTGWRNRVSLFFEAPQNCALTSLADLRKSLGKSISAKVCKQITFHKT